MCAASLSGIFKTFLSDFPGDKPDSVFTDFEIAVKNKKYDIQDMTIIEAVLKEDRDSLKESFIEGFSNYEKSAGSADWNAEKSAKAIEIFLASLDGLVNYYYSNTIAGQFS